jgi:hypothetical protein
LQVQIWTFCILGNNIVLVNIPLSYDQELIHVPFLESPTLVGSPLAAGGLDWAVWVWSMAVAVLEKCRSRSRFRKEQILWSDATILAGPSFVIWSTHANCIGVRVIFLQLFLAILVDNTGTGSSWSSWASQNRIGHDFRCKLRKLLVV